jgi:TATA-box binding protein (TBP) (component of TFIID and TFIIIB)
LAEWIKLECKVQNIVATLMKKVTGSLANYIYEPDNFPGIIYKHNGMNTCWGI